MKKFYLLLGCLLFSSITLLAQQVPQAFSYQAVARDATGTPIANASVQVEIAILAGGPNGNIVYSEQHQTTTNRFGLFQLEIGRGSSGDNFRQINWGQSQLYLQAEISTDQGDIVLGTLPMLSSPMSIVAQRALEDAVDDADADPDNELQTLSLNGTELSISSGNSVDLSALSGPGGGPDMDEQTLTLSGTQLSISNGNSVDLSELAGPGGSTPNLSLNGTLLSIAGGNSIDLAPVLTANTDEQTLALNGTELSISNGNSVDLSALSGPGGGPDMDEQTLTLNGTQLSISNGNSVDLSGLAGPGGNTPNLSLNGTMLSIAGGNSIDLAPILTANTDEQTLSLNGSNLTISNGNTVDLSGLGGTGGGPDMDEQTLSLNGNELSISNGNSVDLGSLAGGGGADADADPTNELQGLSIRGKILTIETGGNPSISLPLYWNFDQSSNAVFYLDGNVELRNNRQLIVRDGLINRSVLFGETTNLHSGLQLSNDQGEGRAYVAVGKNSGVGFFNMFGANGEMNILGGSNSSNPNHGSIGVFGEDGTSNDIIPDAGVYVDDSGFGTIAGDFKNFFMDHPLYPDKQIWYASVEGPEAAAYQRGTSDLTHGEAFIPYSEHFGIVVNPKTVTIQLTPGSADTYGLAVVEKTDKGFRVKELRNGTGNFSFDWEVKGVRKGFENYRVYRSKTDYTTSVSPEGGN